MSITLIAIFSAIIIVSIVLAVSLFRPKKKYKGNRYSKRAPHVEPSLGTKPQLEEFEDDYAYDEIEETETMLDAQAEKASNFKKEATSPLKNNLVVLYLMAPENQPYNGYELLQALLSAGLRYGKMQIFHRHEQKTGRGDILFSLASATSPGTFELPKMGGFSCTGLVLFFEAAKLKDPRKAFEVMIDTAFQLAEDLGGEVLDDQRHELRDDKIAEIADSLGLSLERV